ncbi:TPA: hypothetical protein EYP27_05110 [Candidatus Bathyarchaeota archaeon]|nr:hypothetical protein [Candidatus Bathyarchaeota archaeon]
MEIFDLLVVGGGIGGAWTALTFKEFSREGRAAVVSDEEAPYKRAALVKLIKNPEGRLEVFRDKLEQAGVEYFRGKAVEVDPAGEALLELDDEKRKVGFRKLVMATGGRPGLLSVPGLNLKGVFTFRFSRDALAIAGYARSGMEAYVVGGGLIGLEVAEALLKRGLKVRIIKRVPGVLVGILERDLSLMAAEMFERRGVSVIAGRRLEEIVGRDKVEGVRLSGEIHRADLVVFAMGVLPETSLAEMVGLKLAPSRAIAVNRLMEASLENFYAVGDCAETIDYVTGRSVYRPLGSVASESAEIAGKNATGIRVEHPGNLRIQSEKIFGLRVASLGLTVDEAESLGLKASYLKVEPVRGHPLQEGSHMRVVVEETSSRILGFQSIGGETGSIHTELALAAIRERRTVEWLENKGFKISKEMGFCPLQWHFPS